MRFRLVEDRDFATCRTLLYPGLRLSSHVLGSIVDIWRQLARVGTFTIVEDPTRRYPDAIQGFGISAFVADTFVDDFMAGGRNYLDAHFYEAVADGRSPMLSRTEIARHNSNDGLSTVVLNFGLRQYDVTDPRNQRVLQAASAGFFFVHSGFRIKVMANEVFGTRAANYMAAGGFRLLPGRGPIADLADEETPHLFALRREWIAPGAVHPMSAIFHGPTPVIRFSAAEQRVVLHALWNRSDAEVAAALGLSLDAVKKTWRRIYDRVSRHLPYLFEVDVRPSPRGGRAVEKRRHVVDYLRMHMEEVRPWEGSGRARSARSTPMK